jgi:hypothetical protein
MLRRTALKSRQRREWEAQRASRSEREPKPLHRLERPASFTGTTAGPAPKESVLESAAYESAVRSLGYCVRCGRTCRPQFCHADQGKGAGIKTDVRRGWAGCGPDLANHLPGCHYIVGTSGELPKAERRAEEDRLAAITRAEVLRRGLWPKNVPLWEE